MTKHLSWTIMLLVLALVAGTLVRPNLAVGIPRRISTPMSKKRWKTCIRKSSTAKALGEKAKGILVFPHIVKAGFIIGGQYGEGALLVQGSAPGAYKVVGYYNTIQASWACRQARRI